MDSNKNRESMRNTAAFVLLALCVLLSLLNHWRLEALETQIGNLQTTLSMQISNLGYDIVSISDRVRTEMDKETSIVSSGSMDISLSGSSVRAEAWVAPRELRAGEEVLIVFYIDGTPKAVKATRQEGGRYRAGIDLSPCNTVEAAIVLESGESTRQETFVTLNTRDHTLIYADISRDDTSLILSVKYIQNGMSELTYRLVREETGEQYPFRLEEYDFYRLEFDAIGEQFEGFYALEAVVGDTVMFRSNPMAMTRRGRDMNLHVGDIELSLYRWNW